MTMGLGNSQRSSDADPNNSIASERLRRAIERNRAKQAQRDSRSEPEFKREERVARTSMPTLDSARRSVARADDVEFVPAPAQRRPPKVVATTYKKATKKSKSEFFNFDFSERTRAVLFMLGWVAAGLLYMRVVFSDRGLWDYFKRDNYLATRQEYFQSLITENKQMLAEIEKIKKDDAFQRQLIRDHLGMISSNEYLVIFQDERQGNKQGDSLGQATATDLQH